jgi:hypothetical protein
MNARSFDPSSLDHCLIEQTLTPHMEHPGSLPNPLFANHHLSPFVNAPDAFGLLVGIHGAEFIGAHREWLPQHGRELFSSFAETYSR